jgi:hypothetical protein
MAFLKFTYILQYKPSFQILQTNSQYAWLNINLLHLDILGLKSTKETQVIYVAHCGWSIQSITLLFHDQQPKCILKCFFSLSGYTRHKGVKFEDNLHLRFSCYHPSLCSQGYYQWDSSNIHFDALLGEVACLKVDVGVDHHHRHQLEAYYLECVHPLADYCPRPRSLRVQLRNLWALEPPRSGTEPLGPEASAFKRRASASCMFIGPGTTVGP